MVDIGWIDEHFQRQVQTFFFYQNAVATENKEISLYRV